MTSTPLSVDPDGVLLCPLCRGNYIHLDDVYVAGRAREDGDVIPVRVDHRGHVSEGSLADLPMEDYGRRHVFSLKGWCEICGQHFAIEFKQHKGQTLVKARVPNWSEV